MDEWKNKVWGFQGIPPAVCPRSHQTGRDPVPIHQPWHPGIPKRTEGTRHGPQSPRAIPKGCHWSASFAKSETSQVHLSSVELWSRQSWTSAFTHGTRGLVGASGFLGSRVPSSPAFLLAPFGLPRERWLVVKNPPASAGDEWDMGLFPGSERSPGGGHGNPLLENPMDSRSWWATVHRVAKSWTQLKQLSTSTCTFIYWGHRISTLNRAHSHFNVSS